MVMPSLAPSPQLLSWQKLPEMSLWWSSTRSILNINGRRVGASADRDSRQIQRSLRRLSRTRPNGDAHHICGRTAGKRDDHPDALLNLCRRCHSKAKILRRGAARSSKQPHKEMNHGKAMQWSDISFERHDGDTAPDSGPDMSSMRDAA